MHPNSHIYAHQEPARVDVSPAPQGLTSEHAAVFTPEALQFIGELAVAFQKDIDAVNECR